MRAARLGGVASRRRRPFDTPMPRPPSRLGPSDFAESCWFAEHRHLGENSGGSDGRAEAEPATESVLVEQARPRSAGRAGIDADDRSVSRTKRTKLRNQDVGIRLRVKSSLHDQDSEIE